MEDAKDHYFADDKNGTCICCGWEAEHHPDLGDLEPDSYDSQLYAKIGREMRETNLGWDD